MEDILGSFSAVLKQADHDGRVVEPLVLAAWKRSVEGPLAEHIAPLRLERDRLIAAVASEIWKRNVADLGPQLAAKINAAAGARLVKYIEFQVNAEAVREHRSRSSRYDQIEIDHCIAEQLTPELKTAAESIADEELRDQFLAAAASSLARRCVTGPE